MRTTVTIAFALLALTACKTADEAADPEQQTTSQSTSHETPEEAITAIARGLERLGETYPQLQEFDAKTHSDTERLEISYTYRIGPPPQAAGWRGAAPDPEPQGMFLYIGFHAPDSTRQIHTQPVTLPRHYKDLAVTVLLLEGDDTDPAAEAITQVLTANGVREGKP
jgi:hypothetical protein